MLLILAGVTIAALTGSDSAPSKANEAEQKNDIGLAKDSIAVTAINAKTLSYETAYVGNGVSAENAPTTVGQAVINAVKTYDGTTQGKASIEVTQAETNSIKGDASISITTRDFVVEGTITIEDGILTWGEIEPNVPRIADMPTHLELDSDQLPYTIKASLKGITGSITWSNGGSTVVDASNGTLSLLTSITGSYVTATITASADGCEPKTCEVKINKAMPLAKDVLIVTVTNEGTENEMVTSEKYVNYPMSNGKTATCRVLYNDEQHGLQIISQTIKDTSYQNILTVELGKNTGSDTEQSNLSSNLHYSDTNQVSNCTKEEFSKAKNSYNNMVKTLNDAAYGLMNTNFSEYARCVGSAATGIPVGQPIANPTDEEDVFFSITSAKYNSNYNYIRTCGLVDGTYRYEDTNYIEDHERLIKISAWNAAGNYWLASRSIDTNSSFTTFYGRFATNTSNDPGTMTMCGVNSTGSRTNAESTSLALRPIFYLKSNVKISGGAGTSGDPYTLYAGN